MVIPRELLATKSAVVATAVLRRRLKRNSTLRWLTTLLPLLPLRLAAAPLFPLLYQPPPVTLTWMRSLYVFLT
jgi:hypothetical protein